jgi:hypothetical protein
MPTVGDQRRLRLFRFYSANLSIHAPQWSGVFVCPICGHFFREADVLSGPGLKVDLAHAFPKELGSDAVALECCECNCRLNRAGDNELIKLHKQWEAIRPGSNAQPMHGFAEMPSGRVPVAITAGHIHAHHRAAHPKPFAELGLALQNRIPIDLTVPQVRQQKINVAALHSAYLLFFREFGYGYFATPGGQHVRQLLVDPENLPDDGTFVSIEVAKPSPIDPAFVLRIGVCTMPDKTKCLFAALPSPDPRILCQMILMPGPWHDDLAAFASVQAKAGTWIHGANFSTIDRRLRWQLAAPEYRNAFHLAWSGWLPHNIDMTKLMWAIRAAAKDRCNTKVDAMSIAKRFGITPSITDYVADLAKRGFLLRVPKRGRPHLVRLTKKAIAVPCPERI